MGSSNCDARTRRISIYSHTDECLLLRKEKLKAADISYSFDMTRGDALTKSEEFVSNKLFPDEGLYSRNSSNPSDGWEVDRKSTSTSSMASSSQLSRHCWPAKRLKRHLKERHAISCCGAGYWITTDTEFVVLELTWDES